jgi:pimeloyl-ACP methyl ester carboxylesterase
MRRLAPILLAAVAAVGGAASAPAGTVRHSCVRAGELRFRAADGTRLAGIRFGRGRTAVVLAHQARGDACQWAFYGRRLARLGYLAIAFDFRNNGESQARSGAAGRRLAADVAAAAKQARRLGAKRVFAVGASMGGTAVLAAGVNVRPTLAGIVSLSAPAFFIYDALATAPRLRAPVLYLATKNDGGGGYAADAQRMYEATASSDKQIEILPGSDHGVQLLQYHPRARQLVESFLGSH